MGEPFTLTRSQVRELDRRAMDEYGLPGLLLMENAGRGCAELLMRLNPEKKPTMILCGPGNNGGDGFVMARHLDNAGWPVVVWDHSGDGGSEELRVNRSAAGRVGLTEVPPPAGFASRTPATSPARGEVGVTGFPRQSPKGSRDHATSPLAGEVAEGTQFPGGWGVCIVPGTWVVDALFGTGLSRPLDQPFIQPVSFINASGCPVLAIDIPSGLDCDTGEPIGPCVKATHTATFVAPKRGFLNPKSREWTGEVHVIDIGAPRKLVDEYRS